MECVFQKDHLAVAWNMDFKAPKLEAGHQCKDSTLNQAKDGAEEIGESKQKSRSFTKQNT